MKTSLFCLLIMAGSSWLHASTIESISFDLSALHAGSMLSGDFTLPSSPAAGDTAPVLLTFSDPGDYGESSVSATIMIGNGTALPYTVGFSSIRFTNRTGNAFTKNNNLMPMGLAQCGSFPCTATGGFQDNDPAAFTATYTVAPVTVATPEPAYLPLFGLLFAASMLIRKRLAVRNV